MHYRNEHIKLNQPLSLLIKNRRHKKMRHNFTQLNLLRNKEFYFTNKNEKKIFFKVPTLEDFIADDALQVFLSILNMN
jgi:hypothetical protein